MTSYRRAAVFLALSSAAAMLVLFWAYGGPQVRVTLGALGAALAFVLWQGRETPADRAERIARDIRLSYGSEAGGTARAHDHGGQPRLK